LPKRSRFCQIKAGNEASKPLTDLNEPPCVRLLYRAILTLRVLPDPDLRFFEFGSAWPTYARRYLDAYDPHDDSEPKYCPTPYEVRIYLDVLKWARELSQLQWKIMIYRAQEYSLALIADYLGLPIVIIQTQHRIAIASVAACEAIDKPPELQHFSRRHHCA
jgi:Domain of unknown function (DUF6362)